MYSELSYCSTYNSVEFTLFVFTPSLDGNSDMKPLSSFLKSSWKFLMFIVFCLMAGYALYYSSFTNSELSDIAQSEAIKINRAPKSDMEIAIKTTPQAIKIDSVNVSRSNLTQEERWNGSRNQYQLSDTEKDPSAILSLPTKLNISLSYSAGQHTAEFPTVSDQSNKEYFRQLFSQYSIPPTNTSASSPVVQLSHMASTDSKQVPHSMKRPWCNASGIKSWEHGVVTQFFPLIKRNCSKLIAGSQAEVYNVRQQLKMWKNEESDAQFVQRMSSCANVVEEFSNNFYVSSEEKDFPLAFIFVVYTNARQVVRLLKAIYRPHNLYCIHPDARQGEEFARVFRQISKCLDNVFVASKLERVYYGHHSIMDAQLSCMKDLLVRYSTSRWKYAINVCGREVPMKTNREIVSSLKKLNGYSALGDARRVLPYTWRQRFQYKTVLTRKGVWKTRKKMGPPPSGIRLYKSLTFIAASRQFASYMLTSKKAIAFRNYLRPVYIPEEHFYASLYMLPEAPGGRPVDKSVKVPIVNDVVWLSSRWAKTHRWNLCHGLDVHSVCVLDCYDLHTIFNYESNTFFFNKYFMEKDHIIMECAEEKLMQRNMQEYKIDCP